MKSWAYFRIKHVGDTIHRSIQCQPSDEEDEEHHVGKDWGKVHHLRFRNRDKTMMFVPEIPQRKSSCVILTETRRVYVLWRTTWCLLSSPRRRWPRRPVNSQSWWGWTPRTPGWSLWYWGLSETRSTTSRRSLHIPSLLTWNSWHCERVWHLIVMKLYYCCYCSSTCVIGGCVAWTVLPRQRILERVTQVKQAPCDDNVVVKSHIKTDLEGREDLVNDSLYKTSIFRETWDMAHGLCWLD